MTQKAGYLLADGKMDDLTDLQWRAIPQMVVLIASIENGTYKKGASKHSEKDVMTVEELTALRLGGKVPKFKKEESVFFTEPTSVKKWVTSRVIEENKS